MVTSAAGVKISGTFGSVDTGTSGRALTIAHTSARKVVGVRGLEKLLSPRESHRGFYDRHQSFIPTLHPYATCGGGGMNFHFEKHRKSCVPNERSSLVANTVMEQNSILLTNSTAGKVGLMGSPESQRNLGPDSHNDSIRSSAFTDGVARSATLMSVAT